MYNVIIVTMNKYPNGDAGSIRQQSFARIFQYLGYKVLVVSLGKSTDFKFRTYEGIDYISLRERKNTIITKIKNIVLFNSRLNKIINLNPNIKFVMMTTLFPNIWYYLKNKSIEKGYKLIHDSVEWYSPTEFKFGYFSYSYFINNFYNTRGIDKHFRVVCITDFLKSEFNKRDILTTVIPVIFSTDGFKKIKKERIGSNLRLIYAGNLGSKDFIDKSIQSILELNRRNKRHIYLSVFGITRNSYLKFNKINDVDSNEFDKYINFYGKVSRTDVLNAYQNVDFSILMRPESLRYAKAGFPTKVVESLFSSTPVICNLTSDLYKYIVNLENGIIVKDFSKESFTNALELCLSLNDEQIIEMSIKARELAEEQFDIKKYINKFSEFLN